MRGVSQIFFQDYWLSGAVFIVGLVLHSYKVAIWAVIGSIAGMLIARFFHFPEGSILMGLYGFNASLTAISIAERYIKQYQQSSYQKTLPIFLGIILSVLITRAFEYVDIPPLTTPFVLASWIVIIRVRDTSYSIIKENIQRRS